MDVLRIAPAKAIRGRWLPPGDKSISHRAMIFGALAQGQTEIQKFLESDDCLRTAKICAQLGANVIRLAKGHWLIEGANGFKEPNDVLDCGNSGSSARMLAGPIAASGAYAVLTGDDSLRRRPMRRIADPLRAMGAKIEGREEGSKMPLTILGGNLKGIKWKLPIASAQVKTTILLAGLQADGRTEVLEPYPSRDHTERMLDAFGADLSIAENGALTVEGGQTLHACDVRVPGDISSAAFLIVAALLLPDSELLIRDLGLNATRAGLLEVLTNSGAVFQFDQIDETAGEPIGALRIRSQPLRPITVMPDIVPRLVDEVPILAVAATQAHGISRFNGLSELRTKESDRLHAISTQLRRMGAQIEADQDGLTIEGPVQLKSAEVESFGDHRIAMSLAIAGLLARKGETIINGAECIATSFPNFARTLARLAVE